MQNPSAHVLLRCFCRIYFYSLVFMWDAQKVRERWRRVNTFFPKRREIFNSVCRQLSRQHTISFLIYYFFILPSMERNKKWLRNRNIKTYSSFWVWVWHFFSPVKKKLYRCLIYRENSWLLAVNKPRTKKNCIYYK